MIAPLTERQKTLIVNNIVRACTDISLLNKTGYKFIYLASGFIAHYNMYGFREHYKTRSLRADILANVRANMWYNFHPGDKDYEHYMSLKDVYQRIVNKLL